MTELRVGCSGYLYDDWRGAYYPPHLPKRRWFEHYTADFDTVEINSTFYRLPSASTFEMWRERAPAGFIYALKFSRYGTHFRHLVDPRTWVEPFLEAASWLGPSLGPILVQLPPRWTADPGRLDAFLAAAGHEQRWAVEVRDASWLCTDVYDVLRRHDAALCQHDLLAGHPREITAGWVYLRFHGRDPARPYTGSYDYRVLAGAARRIRHLLDAGLDVFAYFNNDVRACAVFDARRLRSYLAR